MLIVFGKVLSYWCKTIQFRAYEVKGESERLIKDLVKKYLEVKDWDIHEWNKKPILKGIASSLFEILVEEVFACDNREELLCYGRKKCSLTAGDAVILYTKIPVSDEKEVALKAYAYYCKIGGIGTIEIDGEIHKVNYCEEF